jgi:hypothetical protein
MSLNKLAKRRLHFSFFIFNCYFLSALPARPADIILNEIMYHPQSGNVFEEYVELYNRGTNAVNLNGWRFTRGIDYAFPSNTVIGASNYLVVPSHLPTFQAKYPGVLNVTPGWNGNGATTNSVLSNTREEIRLVNAAGQEQDSVTYADEGDWATRRVSLLDSTGARGVEWTADHDGLGKSLELRNPLLANKHGQNWATSLTFNGTPGVANSTRTSNIPPMILEARHEPPVPRSTDTVAITARILDEQTNGLTVRLWFRTHNTTSPGAFISTNMFDDGLHRDSLAGDGVYGAVLPAMADGTIVEFYLEAVDAGARTRTWPAPTVVATDQTGPPTQSNNAVYQVDNGTYSGSQPVFRVVQTETDRSAYDLLPDASDAQFNTTFITTDGTGTEVRYLCSRRTRGAGSRGIDPRGNRISVPNDTPLHGVTDLNLNSQFTHSQLVGSYLAQKAGMVAANVTAIQYRVNGANPASPNQPQFGSFVYEEPFNGDWAATHIPQDGGGNLYRASIGSHTADLSYDPNVSYYLNRGYTKTSNTSENDWTDFLALTDALNNSSDANFAAAVSQWANMEMWMRYFAFMNVITSMETSIANGRGDDYALYRGVNDPRFILLPWDLDTVMGEGDWTADAASQAANIFRMVPAAGAQVPGFQNPNVAILDRIFTNNAFVGFYYRECKRMVDTTFSASQLNPLLDRLLQDFVPQNIIDGMKNYQAGRNAVILSQIPLALTVSNLPPAVSGYPQTVSATIALSGAAPVIDTAEVRVNGVSADWLRWRGIWSRSGIALNPGINRVLIQALDTNALEVARLAVDIWYDDGNVAGASGTLPADTIWSAAAGPYNVTANLTIPAGRTLTINPGTTVYLASGVSITVNGTLVANGTDTQRIRFTRTPGSATSWGGIVFSGSNSGSSLSYIDFEYANSAGHNLQLVNSSLAIDHCSWANTTNTIIETSSSSFTVRNSIFPTLNGAEHIHGGPIPAAGYAIIEGNIFGGTAGLNDIIDFSGAQRPGPVLQVLNNVFTAATDDVLDLDGTDAHVEGNVFMHVHKNNTGPGDTASAISYGQSGGYGPHIVAVRNLFFDVDHVALCKEGGYLTLVNNTAVGIGIAAVNFSEPERNTVPGFGATIDGNIFHNPAGYAGTNLQNRFPTNGTVALVVRRNIFSSSDGVTNGVDGNLIANPRLVNTDTNTITAASIWRDFALRSGSPASGTGPNGLDRGGVVPAGASISGEPSSPTPLTGATLTLGGPGISNYIYRVNGGGWSGEFPVATPITLSSLANGSYTVEVRGRNTAGVLQSVADATASRTWTVNTALARVLISEVLARNATVLSVDGESPDLIELWNAGANTVDLADMGLSDDPADPYKFAFPPNTALDPGDRLVVYADAGAGGGFWTGFGLDQDGDALYLFDKPANGGALLDSVVFGPQLADRSIGRMPDGTWTLNLPTFGSANVALPVGDVRTLKVNEWLARALAVYPVDFVEIYNPDALPVDLGGLYLTDEPAGFPARHRILPLSFVAAGGHVVFRADGDTDKGANHLGFKLSTGAGAIGLFAPLSTLNTNTSQLALIDCVYYEPQFTDVSEGRRPSGGSTISFLSTPTPGAANPGFGGSTTISNFTTSIPLLYLSNSWRYEASGTNLFTAWRASGYNDSSWSNGQGLLAFEVPGVYAEPIRTVLPTNTTFNGFQITNYYFRTHFSVTTDLTGFTLSGTAHIDDGAVIYINGTEVQRIRMPGGAITATTFTSSTATEPATDALNIPISALVQGDNVMAVEVHQSTATSSDIVFGLSLAATHTVSVTNVTGVNIVLNELLASPGTLTNIDGTSTDWVEIYNPSTNLVDLADMSLSDDLATPRRWVIPAGNLLDRGSYLVVKFDSGSAPSTNNGPLLNSGFGLNNNGDALYLFDALSRGGTLIDSVVFGLQASGFSIGRVPVGTGPWQLTQPTRGAANLTVNLGNVANLRINEWMANPKSGDDWFEVYNPNPQPVALGGYFFTDDLGNRTLSPIPALTFIGVNTNGYAQFKADSNPSAGADHVDFKLDKDGDTIALYPPGSAPLTTKVTFGTQVRGVSEGLFTDGGPTVIDFPDSASPGESNYLPLDPIAFSEALTHTDPPFEDAIELQNISPGSVDLSGWFISDDNDYLTKFRIPNGAVIPPGGFAVFYEYQFNPEPGRSYSFPLSSAKGDTIHLAAADALGNLTGYRTSVKFGASSNGVSFGRYETSTGPDFTAMLSRTLGADNPASLAEFRSGTGRTNSAPLVGPMVITEIMYHPPDIGTNDNAIDEYIELRNISGATVQLYDPANPGNRWKLRDAVSFTFPSNRTVTAGTTILVVPFDPANATQLNDFRAKYTVSPVVPIYGPWSGKLDNSSDSVELARPDAPEVPPSPDAGLVPYFLVDKVKYSDDAPWPTYADGYTNALGYSLHRRVNSQYGNDAVNWQAGAPTPGATASSPVTTLPVITTPLSNLTAVVGQDVTFAVTATGAAPLTYQWRYYGRLIEGETNATLVLSNVQASAEGRYSVVACNPSGAAASGPVMLSFQSPPVILSEPQDRVVLAGSTVTFSVVAGGSPPLRYSWFKDGGALGGQTNSSLVLNAVQAANQGGYSVIITNGFGSATSMVATLTINTPPGISQQPQNLIVNAGSTANFSVTATGSAPLRYQWRFEGADMPGETNFTLAINNAQGGSAGDYTVRITNAVGSITSTIATLTVVLPPVVTVAATDASASESGPNTGAFTITRSYATNSALAVAIALSGSAAGSDYVAINSPVTIPANQTTATVIVTPVDDGAVEQPETVILTLQAGAGYTVGGASSATVTIADNDNLAPSVTITNPPDGTLFIVTPTNIVLSANATDSDGTVSKVEFYWQGTNKVGEATTAPFTITWTNASAGSNALTAIATDDFSGRGTSAPVYLVLNAMPAVSITNPVNNASFATPANITINAAAADSDGTVTQVQFFADGASLGVDVSSPYTVTWNNVAAGNYVLTARAMDNRGAARTSAGINISVTTVVPILTNIFADRVTITGTPLTILANSGTGATTGVETGEPTQGVAMTRTMWIAWTAPVSASVVMDTFGSSYNTTLAAYTGTAVNALTTVAFNNDAAGGLQSQIMFNAVAGTTYNIQVGGITGAGSGSIVLHITAPSQAPSITTEPQSQTVNLGANVTFTVAASGATPFSYQWRLNGADLGGATSSNLTLNSVTALNEGAYSVRVSNAFGATNSTSATLTVNDGLVTTYTTQLIGFNGSWRYNQAGVDLGTTWREKGFIDAGWPSGQSLLGYEIITTYPEPFRTTLNVSNGPTSILTYYFRTHFTLSNDLSAMVMLTSTNLLDDGAVYYLNGTEVGRIRIPGGAVDYNTLGVSPPIEGVPDTLPIPSASRVPGDNVMAVEVHQSSIGSSDVAFGMSLHATVTFTNRPVITNPLVLGNGSFRGTLVGIAGRRYAVDFTPTLGGAWTQLVIFTNQTSQTLFTDPGAVSAGARFYRGRLAP